MPHYDLHSHSTRSDGLLSPADLVRRAAQRGVDVLALTDHDELAGLEEASEAARESGLRLIAGSELSVSWRDITLHILGLGIDPACPTLREGLAAIRSGRTDRARRIAAGLADAGIEDAYEGALSFVTSESLISRTHFARFLVDTGHVRDMKDVFRHFLVKGKPGYVDHEWTPMTQAITWIHAAGGLAVVAHPGRYKVSAAGMRELLSEFRDSRGDGIEVLSPSHSGAQVEEFARHARTFGFLASSGSDYHGPGESWVDLGDMPPLPVGVEPVWKNW
jgi:predicted metal-dependent phosphoesterase TrpH